MLLETHHVNPTESDINTPPDPPRMTEFPKSDIPFQGRSGNRAVNVVPVSGPCCICGTPARFRCSHCKSQLYCSKTCQLVDWRSHMKDCDTILRSLQLNKRSFHLLDQCFICEKDIISRVIGWELMCQSCYQQKGQAYFSPEPSSEYLSYAEYFKFKRCQRTCSQCHNSTLLILRDEAFDEWLVCFTCAKMKQLLRCWNEMSHRHVVSIDPPVIHCDQIDSDDVMYLFTA